MNQIGVAHARSWTRLWLAGPARCRSQADQRIRSRALDREFRIVPLRSPLLSVPLLIAINAVAGSTPPSACDVGAAPCWHRASPFTSDGGVAHSITRKSVCHPALAHRHAWVCAVFSGRQRLAAARSRRRQCVALRRPHAWSSSLVLRKCRCGLCSDLLRISLCGADRWAAFAQVRRSQMVWRAGL